VTLPADAAVIGAAGAGREMEQQELAQALIAHGVARQVRVVADAEIALAAAFDKQPGIFVSAGTGSIAYARAPNGATYRCGGYGWQLGDEGGGYWVGRRALEAAGKAQDGRGEGSTLLARLLVALGLHDFADLVRWTSLAAPAQVAALAPHLLNAARDGEVVARQVVQQGAHELVALVAVLAKHFPSGSAIAVATGGGLLSHQSPLYAGFRDALTRALPAAQLRDDAIDPPLGALRLARDLVASR
jgi:glucosamine kinase